MSGKWWESAKTTQGHGIVSQYKPDHLKEWVVKDTRRLERSTSPERVFQPGNSLYKSSVPVSLKHQEPIEHRHHASTKSLEGLRQYQQPPAASRHDTGYLTDPKVALRQPLQSTFLPHLAHHHHFGWNPPTPEARIAVPDIKDNFYKYGNAQTYNHTVVCKHSLITTRKA